MNIFSDNFKMDSQFIPYALHLCFSANQAILMPPENLHAVAFLQLFLFYMFSHFEEDEDLDVCVKRLVRFGHCRTTSHYVTYYRKFISFCGVRGHLSNSI